MAILTTRTNGETITAPWFNSIKTLIDNDLVLTPLSVTADKTLGVDANVISADSSSAAIDLDLPAVADNDKKYYILKATDLTNDVIVNPDGSDTIDGETEYTFANLNESIAIVGDATNSNWVIVATSFDSTGGGGGGADIPSTYLVLTPEAYNVSTWDVTNLTNATMAIETTEPLAGDSSYDLSTTTAAVAEYCSSPAVAVPLRSRAKTNSISFPYTYDGSDDEITVEAYDNTNSNSLGTLNLEAASTSKTAQLNFYMPESCEEIEFRVYITVTSASELIFDDVVFSDSPFTYQNLISQSDAYAHDISTAGVTYESDGGSGYFAGGFSITGDVSEFFTTTSIGNGYRFKANKKVSYDGGFAVLAAGSVLASLYINGSVRITQSSGPTASGNWAWATGSGTLEKDDYIELHVSNANVVATGIQFYLNCTSETAAVVHSSTGTENTFSANIANPAGVASIGSQSSPDSPAIASVNRSAEGIVDITFTAGFFTQTPAVFALVTTVTATADRYATIQNNDDENSVTIVIKNSAGSNKDSNFKIMLQNQGADYKNPSAYAVTPLTQTCYIKDVKASGTEGGTFTSGAWQTRDLNTVSGDSSWVALAANQFTLAPGKYEYDIESPGYQAGGHQIKLVSDPAGSPTDVEFGSTELANSGVTIVTKSRLIGSLTLSEATPFEVQHKCIATKATNGLGIAASLTSDEIYTQVKITKLTWA